MPVVNFDTVALTDLLARARAGDSQAIGDLIARAQTRLEALARKMLRTYPDVHRWEDTGDVLNAALLRLTRALEVVNPVNTRGFFALAAEQIRRELLDLARHYRGTNGLGRNYRSGFAPVANGHAAVPEPAAHQSNSDDLDWWAEFHAAVEQLPADEREAFSMTFYHGCTQKQIAEVMKVTERSIRRYLRSAASILAERVPLHPPSG